MINPEAFYKAIQERGIGLFTGVPDSLLKHLCAFVDHHCSTGNHILTANEGNAVALAAGYYMSTGKMAAVYMQNSGLGNCVNPLTSLTDPQVYSIPMLLIIGWRGEPGVKDEPQHVKMGRITPAQLDLLEIPYRVLDAATDPEPVLDDLFSVLESTSAPAALLVRKNTFQACTKAAKNAPTQGLKREQALRALLGLAGDSLVISTTGKTSREVFEIRTSLGHPQQDFLTVGSMGHASSIALGTALGNPGKKVICLDGDGAMLMHMGTMAITGSQKPQGLIHVILNNQAHESVGGQPTVAGNMDLRSIALGCGYSFFHQARDEAGIRQAWENLLDKQGPALLEIKIQPGSRADLGRPTSTPIQNKQAFMEKAHA
ncbi:phosphonopyruvate decarboxylase [Desulfonatronospira thiodismutans ASO3-1]|uniref:Phosphonopyruvate decarboxylase n=1 Tax=Desulfonatronospira thiodismutans ASO3-1 TaxID=555779 RepID=D6SU49_9BACT|nr:phosphonopyruvate decarboxylase [Desulfonatronospira thiodismutans]EFI32829.1 phosphonopyruvate decarboxylase [Desulfonatronospira thiodismutans ASO3-1]